MKTKDYPMQVDEMKRRSIAIHGEGAFDRSMFEPINNSKEKVVLKCLTCYRIGKVRWSSHLGGVRCRGCTDKERGLLKRVPMDELEARVEKLFPGMFSFENLSREGDYVTLTCKKHGVVTVFIDSLLAGHNGCVGCTGGARIKHENESFILLAKALFPEYLYDRVVYGKNNKVPVEVGCPIHGYFWVRPDLHLAKKQGCPKCNKPVSVAEDELFQLISSWLPDVEILRNKRDLLESGRELDIFIPSIRLAIEYNGVYYHSSNFRPEAKYHLNKTEECEKQSIRLIQIFSDEWLRNRGIVESRLKAILGIADRHYARKLVLKKVSWSTAKEFIENNHLQGPGPLTSLCYVLATPLGEIIACMSFTKLRFSEQEEGVYELSRYCSRGVIVGGFSKLLTSFVREISPVRIVSYADRRWSQGGVYLKNGFDLIHKTQPGYFWVSNSGVRYNRMNFQKHKLEKVLKVFDPNKTETENCESNGLAKLYDCGNLVFELKV